MLHYKFEPFCYHGFLSTHCTMNDERSLYLTNIFYWLIVLTIDTNFSYGLFFVIIPINKYMCRRFTNNLCTKFELKFLVILLLSSLVTPYIDITEVLEEMKGLREEVKWLKRKEEDSLNLDDSMRRLEEIQRRSNIWKERCNVTRKIWEESLQWESAHRAREQRAV